MAADDFSASTSTAGSLQLGSISSGTHEVWTDADWFKISLTAGISYTFEAAHTFSTRDTDSSVLLAIHDAAGDAAAATIRKTWAGSIATFTPAGSGDYFVAVRGNLATVLAVDYTVRAGTLPDGDVGDTAANAGTMELGKTLTGTFEALPDIDSYNATLEAGTTYAISPVWGAAGIGGTPAALIRVLGPDGEYIISGTNDGGASFAFSTTKAGTYTISAAASNSSGHTGPYTLTLNKPADDHGATLATAGALTVGKTQDGMLEAAFDRDLYAVTLVAGQTYWLTLANPSNRRFVGGELQLIDANGTMLAKETGQVYSADPLLISYVPQQSGTYYLQASDERAAIGSYQIAAAAGTPDDHGDSMASASKLEAGVVLVAKTQYGGDKDVYKIAVEAGTTYLFELKASTTANMAFLTLSGADANGSTSNLVSYGDAALSGYLSYTASFTGDYYITAESSKIQREIAYTLKASIPAADDYASSAATTGTLLPGTRVAGVLNYRGDADWFKLSAKAGEKYALRLDGKGHGGTLGVEYNKSTLEIHYGASMGSLTPMGGLEGAYYGFTATRSGDYYVAVRQTPYPGTGTAADHATGSYLLTSFDVTADKAAPVLTGLSPGNGAVNASPTADIGILFNEAIRLGSGAIRLLDKDGAVVQSWTSQSHEGLTLLDKLVLLNPWDALQPGQTYTIDMPAGSILDLAGNGFPGTSQYHFTTAPVVAASTAGNDFLAGTGMGKSIDGGAGIDTVLFNDNRQYYLISKTGQKTTVTSGSSNELPGDTLVGVERLKFRDASIAVDIDGHGGQAYRMYQAAFNRAPDKAGLGYWMKQLDDGMGLTAVADSFLASPEAQALYGTQQSDSDFLTSLYGNVLHRAPDTPGLAFWLGHLQSGAVTRAQLLSDFSESTENYNNLLPLIADGFAYTPYG